MPRKSNYPEWVTKHIQKGQYVNHVNGRYYLYTAHSERREGVDHPVRVCDAYLGRITQEEGFIPSKKRPRKSTRPADEAAVCPPASRYAPSAWNYGSHYAVIHCTDKVLKGLNTTYCKSGILIYVCSILEYLHGISNSDLYRSSVLSLLFPDVVFPEEPGSEIISGIDRGKRMVSEIVKKTYGEDWMLLNALLTPVVLMKSRSGITVPALSPAAFHLADKYGLEFSKEAASNLFPALVGAR